MGQARRPVRRRVHASSTLVSRLAADLAEAQEESADFEPVRLELQGLQELVDKTTVDMEGANVLLLEQIALRKENEKLEDDLDACHKHIQAREKGVCV